MPESLLSGKLSASVGPPAPRPHPAHLWWAPQWGPVLGAYLLRRPFVQSGWSWLSLPVWRRGPWLWLEGWGPQLSVGNLQRVQGN